MNTLKKKHYLDSLHCKNDVLIVNSLCNNKFLQMIILSTYLLYCVSFTIIFEYEYY